MSITIRSSVYQCRMEVNFKILTHDTYCKVLIRKKINLKIVFSKFSIPLTINLKIDIDNHFSNSTWHLSWVLWFVQFNIEIKYVYWKLRYLNKSLCIFTFSPSNNGWLLLHSKISIHIYLVSKTEMLSCIFAHVRVYILFYFFMNFFESRANDLRKPAWRNIGILGNQLRGQNSTCVMLARKHLSVFSAKVKSRGRQMGWDVWWGQDSRKEQSWATVRSWELDPHSILAEPIAFSYWFHPVSLAPCNSWGNLFSESVWFRMQIFLPKKTLTTCPAFSKSFTQLPEFDIKICLLRYKGWGL